MYHFILRWVLVPLSFFTICLCLSGPRSIPRPLIVAGLLPNGLEVEDKNCGASQRRGGLSACGRVQHRQARSAARTFYVISHNTHTQKAQYFVNRPKR